MDTLLRDDLNCEMKELLNQRAVTLKKERQILCERLEDIRLKARDSASVLDLAAFWQSADYACRKSIAMQMIHRIGIGEDGAVTVVWNI